MKLGNIYIYFFFLLFFAAFVILVARKTTKYFVVVVVVVQEAFGHNYVLQSIPLGTESFMERLSRLIVFIAMAKFCLPFYEIILTWWM